MDTVLGLPFATLLALGFAAKVLGFIVRDELLLRLLVTAGLVLDALYYALRADPILGSVATNTVLFGVNAVLIGAIALERTTWWISAEDKALLARFDTLRPGHFRRIMRHAMRLRTEEPRIVAHEGEAVTNLCYIIDGRYTVAKGGERFETSGPAFVGEIAFLTGRPSSATVELPAGTEYVAFPFAHLKAAMARSPSLHNALVALFSEDLALKVALSAPILQRGDVALAPDDGTVVSLGNAARR